MKKVRCDSCDKDLSTDGMRPSWYLELKQVYSPGAYAVAVHPPLKDNPMEQHFCSAACLAVGTKND